MSSIVEICNQALTEVGGNKITSLDGNSAESELCKLHYYPCVNNLLTSRFWTFAKKRAKLSQINGSPVSEYSYAYGIPSDSILIRLVTDGDGREIRDWQVENGTIVCDESNVYVEYTYKVTDTNKFSPSFESALVYLLASRLAIPISGNRNLKIEMYNIYKSELADASPIDGRQGAPSTIGRRSSRLINRRWRGWQE